MCLAASRVAERQHVLRAVEELPLQKRVHGGGDFRLIGDLEANVLTYSDRVLLGGHYEYYVAGTVGCLLEELIADPPVPLSILADSLVRDQRDRSFEPWLGHRGPDRATENLLAARMVAHEVRNVVVPLRATLRRFVEEVGTAEDTARMGQHRTRMEEGLARLLSFADEQLRVASLGIGPRSPFPLLDAITDAVHLTTLERNSRVSVAVSPDIPRVSLSGVREHLVSVLVNLIRNAACSRPADPVQVWIRARFDEETVVLMVDDNGPGVPPDLQNRIFEQGFSLRGGSGQGLSLARTLLGDMRAEIRCEDSPEGGARFILEIPVLARTP